MTNSKTKKALTDLALLVAMFVAIAGQGLLALSQASDPAQQSKSPTPIPPRVAQAQRFLAQRGWGANRGRIGNASVRASALISRPITEAKQRNRGLATTWARDCSNCELWTCDRTDLLHRNRSRGHNRQQGVHRHYGGRSLGVAERGHCERGPGAVHTPHRQAVRIGRRARRVHQYRRAYRAAGWDWRHPGGHRRPQ